MGIESAWRAHDVAEDVVTEGWMDLGDDDGCVKDIGWGFGKMGFRIGFGLSCRVGYTSPVPASASLRFIDG
jgi:hypothetical protein